MGVPKRSTSDSVAPDRALAPHGLPADPTADPFLTVARVVRAHGTAGELTCEIVTDFPERFRRVQSVYLRPQTETGPPRLYAVRRARLVARGAGQQLVLSIEGIDDRDGAEALRGHLVMIPESQAWKLPQGRFYWHQIIGLRAVTAEGRELGTVKDILETGANDVYVVRSERGELLLPAIKDVVKEISPERGLIVVQLLPGMGDA